MAETRATTGEVPQSTIGLIASIGNPEPRYHPTRHNAGHWLADKLVDTLGGEWQKCSVADGWLATSRLLPCQTKLFKSGRAMNLSGPAIARVAHYYRVPTDKLLILHDELDFDPGVVRMKYSGGTSGHNGLKSIIDSLGSRDFWRCRIGIGRPPRPQQAISYVLHAPSADEAQLIDAALDHAGAQLSAFACGHRQRAIEAIVSGPSALLP